MNIRSINTGNKRINKWDRKKKGPVLFISTSIIVLGNIFIPWCRALISLIFYFRLVFSRLFSFLFLVFLFIFNFFHSYFLLSTFAICKIIITKNFNFSSYLNFIFYCFHHQLAYGREWIYFPLFLTYSTFFFFTFLHIWYLFIYFL